MEAALREQRSRNLDRARELYTEVLSQAPDTFDALHMLGVIEMEMGDFARAEELIQASLRLAPTAQAQDNLGVLYQRWRAREGMYSLRTIQLVDAIGVFSGSMPRFGQGREANAPVEEFFASGGALHIVVPGDVLNAASNHLGLRLLGDQQKAGRSAKLWCNGTAPAAPQFARTASAIDAGERSYPVDGCVAIAGLNPAMLEWLPLAAEHLETIFVLFDARDPQPLCALLGQLPLAALGKLRFVARSKEILDDFGLEGIVDPHLLAKPLRAGTSRRPSAKPRIGVFLMPLGGRDDLPRWDLLAWLRSQEIFIRLLYPRPLPSPHLPNDEEHLISLVSDWSDAWGEDLDALVYWGAEQRAHQFDSLLVEARAQGLPIVADHAAETAGLGEFDEVFFTAEEARNGVSRLLEKLRG